MRKAELLETINRQKKQIEDQKKLVDEQKKQIEDQLKAIENVMGIFKILAEGGHIDVHIHSNKEPSYFVTPKGGKCDLNMCSRKTLEGLYSRGLLVVTRECVHEDFAVQTYVLRFPKED